MRYKKGQTFYRFTSFTGCGEGHVTLHEIKIKGDKEGLITDILKRKIHILSNELVYSEWERNERFRTVQIDMDYYPAVSLAMNAMKTRLKNCLQLVTEIDGAILYDGSEEIDYFNSVQLKQMAEALS